MKRCSVNIFPMGSSIPGRLLLAEMLMEIGLFRFMYSLFSVRLYRGPCGHSDLDSILSNLLFYTKQYQYILMESDLFRFMYSLFSVRLYRGPWGHSDLDSILSNLLFYTKQSGIYASVGDLRHFDPDSNLHLWLTDPDPTPDPTPFFSNIKDAFSYFFLINYPQHHYLQS